MLKEIPRGSTFVIRLVEPLKAGFGRTYLITPSFSFFLTCFPRPCTHLTSSREGLAGMAEVPPAKLSKMKEGYQVKPKVQENCPGLRGQYLVWQKSMLDLRNWFDSLEVGQLGTQCSHGLRLLCLPFEIYIGATNKPIDRNLNSARLDCLCLLQQCVRPCLEEVHAHSGACLQRLFHSLFLVGFLC